MSNIPIVCTCIYALFSSDRRLEVVVRVAAPGRLSGGFVLWFYHQVPHQHVHVPLLHHSVPHADYRLLQHEICLDCARIPAGL